MQTSEKKRKRQGRRWLTVSDTPRSKGDHSVLVSEEEKKKHFYKTKTGEKKMYRMRRKQGRRGLTVSDNLCNKGDQPVLVSGNAFRQLTQGCQHFIRVTEANHLRHTTAGIVNQEEGANHGGEGGQEGGWGFWGVAP